VATELVRTIKESGGHYTSLSAWEAAAGGISGGNLVTNDVIAVAECYGRTSADATTVLLNGFTTDATHWVEIRAASGEEYRGVDGVGYILRASASRALLNYCAHLRIYGITIDVGTQTNSYQSTTPGTFTGTPDIRIVGCRLIGNAAIGTSSTAYQFSVVNTVLDAVDHAASSNVTVLMLGCTQTARYTLRENNPLTTKNCINNAADAYTKNTGATITALNCALKENSLADISTNLGGCRQGQTFTFSGTGDWHLSESDAGARGYGADISSDYSALWLSATDIDGQTITTWSIGADAQAGAAGGGIQDASHVASGGAIAGGSAASAREQAVQGSGGASTGGAAQTSKEAGHVASGGAVSGGAADTSTGAAQDAQHVASGGAVSGGSADSSREHAAQASGGAVSGGSAVTSKESASVGQGGAVSGGQASQAREATATGSGGAVSGGAAVASASTAGDSEDVAEVTVSGVFISDITIEVAGMFWVEHVVPGSIH